MVQKSFATSIPLFDIELDHVVLDELHLMMRITKVIERESKANFLKKMG